MVYDSNRRVIVLFGGNNGMSDVGDTWEWSRGQWSHRVTATAPSAREGHAMSYDPVRGVTVLFGGDNGGNETWEWNGAQWSQRAPANPPPTRVNHAMTYDESRNVTILFGGADGGITYGDTWEWDGTHWNERMPMPSPPARFAPAMTYDAARELTVLTCGFGTTGQLNDTWELEGPSFHISTQPSPQFVAAGATAHFSVAADGVGVGGFTYRWRHNGMPIFDDVGYSGAATKMLTVLAAAPSKTGNYDCVVSGTCGSIVSLAASLAVDDCLAIDDQDDCDGNGYLDTCEIAANAALDANLNGTLDECEPEPADPCEADGGADDCNGNHVKDSCEIDANPDLDSDNNGTLDTCDPPSIDLCVPVNGEGDCNSNGLVDACEIAVNPNLDANNNGMLDSCEVSPAPLGTDGDMTDMSSGAPCGGGTAMLLPTGLLGFAFRRRRRSR
ncbi:MAG: hypothetical protein H6818_20245 [Phycisphaerales bacterium]|nr:hypothetical protein [Phycisphaerales bacterium]